MGRSARRQADASLCVSLWLGCVSPPRVVRAAAARAADPPVDELRVSPYSEQLLPPNTSQAPDTGKSLFCSRSVAKTPITRTSGLKGDALDSTEMRRDETASRSEADAVSQ